LLDNHALSTWFLTVLFCTVLYYSVLFRTNTGSKGSLGGVLDQFLKHGGETILSKKRTLLPYLLVK